MFPLFKFLRFISFAVLFSMLMGSTLFAQNQANIWYFGYGSGLNFSSGSPVAIAGGQINAYEGCATACDASSGLLLFYTDGIKVWNKNHLQMPNGFGLFGDNFSSASALIVPRPGSPNLFYIFTTTGSAAPARQMHYSVVDMSLNAGLGDVTIKNTLLLNPSCEKLTGVYHCNGTDTWVIAHELYDSSFHAFLLTAGGISPAVVSSVGAANANGKGYMKASPNGKKIGLSANSSGGGVVQLFDFNNFTGVVSNPISLPPDFCNYAVSFSPDNSKFYVTGFEYCPQEQLFQYDLSSGIPATIIASKTYIATENFFGALQNAPDGKMYLALDVHPSLSVINNPNAPGLACNYVSSTINLTSSSSHGLPYFIESYFNQLTFNLGNDTTVCSSSYPLNAGAGWASYLWSTGDTTQNILVTSAGNYWVTVSNGSCTTSDTIQVLFNSYVVDLGNDTSLCVGDSVTVNAGPGTSWLWSTGATTQSININTAGSYWVTVNNGPCSGSDTIQVQFNSYSVNLGNDTALCVGDSVTVNAGPGTSWLWSTGATTQSITINTAGSYWVLVNNGACSGSDTIQVQFNSFSVNIGNDTTACDGSVITLDAGAGSLWLWSTGQTTQTINVNASGAYWVRASLGTCIASDTIQVTINPISVNIGNDTAICNGDMITLNAGATAGSYLWSTGDTSSSINISAPGIYWVTVNNGSCYATDSIVISELIINVNLGEDIITCESLSVPLDAGTTGTSYFWSTGETTRAIEVFKSGTYWVNVIAGDCSASDTVEVTIDFGGGAIYFPNAFTPNRDQRNNVFKALGTNVTHFDLRIYNRWGELCFESKDINEGWDGTYQGRNVGENTFIWICDYMTACTEPTTLRKIGHVSIIK